MGDFFKEKYEVSEEPPVEQAKFITDFATMKATFQEQERKIDDNLANVYDIVIPISVKLTGTKQTPDDTGSIGSLRRRLETNRLSRLPVGQLMYEVTNDIEEFNNWTERMMQYTEAHIEGLRIICKSAFALIERMEKDMDNLKEQLQETIERVNGDHNLPPVEGLIELSKEYRNFKHDKVVEQEDLAKQKLKKKTPEKKQESTTDG